MFSKKSSDLDLEINSQDYAIRIPGLTYLANYINVGKQHELLSDIDREEWSTILKRRVQHHGYRYKYKKGLLTSSSYLGALPDWAQSLANRLSDDGLTTNPLDQVIVNEYNPGQGIASHIDCIPCFGNTIISLSLGSSCVMELTHSLTQEKVSILLFPGTVLVLQGEARYDWEHSIATRKKDKYQGKEFVRTRRVSLTFREVLFPYK
jgi:alkylated DNA repair dioxygenase AlkB